MLRTTATMVRQIGLSIAIITLLCAPAGALPSFSGSWQIDTDVSDEPKKIFKGKLRKRDYPVPRVPGATQRDRTSVQVTQARYFELLRDKHERKSKKDLRRLGAAYPLITATQLEIEEQDDGYLITYDEELPRFIRPNPNGRVFSAKGDELVKDGFGHTLSYWDKEYLKLETDLLNGGKVKETLEHKDGGIYLKIRLEMHILEEPVELTRVFRRRG
ncbi:MAG: hypothetical protein AAF384_19120 [Pseudomonadota bacterium]